MRCTFALFAWRSSQRYVAIILFTTPRGGEWTHPPCALAVGEQCMHSSSDTQHPHCTVLFPSKLPVSVGIWTQSNALLIGPTLCIIVGSVVFAQLTVVLNTWTVDKQTDSAHDICSNRPHLHVYSVQAMRHTNWQFFQLSGFCSSWQRHV